MHRLIEYLKKHTLLADGAMGTYYGEKYQEDGFLVEKANLLFPERIKEIHLEYLKSGARLLRTNTFAINTGFFATREEMKKHIAKIRGVTYRSGDQECAAIAFKMNTYPEEGIPALLEE